ncbi:hypothetical protein QTO01_13280 [Vibrio mytili]|nr:hypothetical protein [Vibrio mytili]
MKRDMDSGHTAEQIDTQKSEPSTHPQAEKLKDAYIQERAQLEITEVELNRSKIMMIDENGKMRPVPILSEH